jgi:hypothetical protein
MLSKNLFLFLFLSMFLITSCAKKVAIKQEPTAAAQENTGDGTEPVEPVDKNSVPASIPDELLGIWESGLELNEKEELIFTKQESAKCDKDCLSLSIEKTATTLTIKFATDLDPNEQTVEFHSMTNAEATYKDKLLNIKITNLNVGYDSKTRTASFTNSVTITFNEAGTLKSDFNVKAILSADSKSLTVKDRAGIDLLFSYIGFINSVTIETEEVRAAESKFEESNILDPNSADSYQKITGDLIGEITSDTAGKDNHIIKARLKKWDNTSNSRVKYINEDKDYIVLRFSSSTEDKIEEVIHMFQNKSAKALDGKVKIAFKEDTAWGTTTNKNYDGMHYKGKINKIEEKDGAGEITEMDITVYIPNTVYDKIFKPSTK